jgi:hypothetical protein
MDGGSGTGAAVGGSVGRECVGVLVRVAGIGMEGEARLVRLVGRNRIGR